MSSELDYERDTAIDEQALDVEWLRQPDLMRKYSMHAAETKRLVDETKERLDVVRARLDLAIRENPQKFGLEKVTEAAIAATILLQDEYQEASKGHLDAKYEYEIALAAVRAIDQKKTALENLVRLLAASYFAGPQAPRNLTGEVLKRREQEQGQRQANARVRIRSKR